MGHDDQPPEAVDGCGEVGRARELAERGLQAQAEGRLEEADQLLMQAQGIDPDATAQVLRAHDAARAADARPQDVANRDVEDVLPRIVPGPAEGSA